MSDNSVMESQRLSFDSCRVNMFFVFIIFSIQNTKNTYKTISRRTNVNITYSTLVLTVPINTCYTSNRHYLQYNLLYYNTLKNVVINKSKQIT